jgi:hypothetical protein
MKTKYKDLGVSCESLLLLKNNTRIRALDETEGLDKKFPCYI